MRRGQKRTDAYLPEGVTLENYLRKWQEYIAERDMDCRNQLVEWNMGLVYWTVRYFKGKLPNQMEVGDLIGYGVIGLLEAIERYDPDYQVSFATFALPRISGSMWSGIEKCVGIPRRLFQKRSQLQAAYMSLCQRMQREPGEKELAMELGLEVEEYRRLRLQILWKYEFMENVSERTEESFEEKCELECLKRQLGEAMKLLSTVERTVLQKLYQDGYSMRKLSREWNVSRWRIQRLHRQALQSIQEKIM